VNIKTTPLRVGVLKQNSARKFCISSSFVSCQKRNENSLHH